MKSMIITVFVAMTMATSAFAQQTRRTTKVTTQTAPAQTYTPSYSYANNEVTALLGMTSGAANFGVDYARMNNGMGWGGYFFMLSKKERNNVLLVSQVMSFGGLFKINVIDNSVAKFYVAPGFGIAVVKDGNATGTTPSDETVFGLSWKMGVTWKIAQNFNFGLETTSMSNFFSDSLTSYNVPAPVYSLAGSFMF